MYSCLLEHRVHRLCNPLRVGDKMVDREDQDEGTSDPRTNPGLRRWRRAARTGFEKWAGGSSGGRGRLGGQWEKMKSKRVCVGGWMGSPRSGRRAAEAPRVTRDLHCDCGELWRPRPLA